jgi:hypothetical protein
MVYPATCLYNAIIIAITTNDGTLSHAKPA